jgi:(1->4)-alpha-D-glucan 1-alpha-D-glucosylmutase
MHRALELRQKQHDVFRHGTYQALRLEGETKENLIGFSRSYEGETIVTLLPRFSYSLADGKVELPLAAVWGDATLTIPELKGTKLRNVFTDEEIGSDATGKLVLGAAFGKFPVALLTTRLAK